MGFQGSLDSVNLGDIFQTLAMNRQTGTLVVNRPGEEHYIWFAQGDVALCDGVDKDGGPWLLNVLFNRDLLNSNQAAELKSRLYQSKQPLRELLLSSGMISDGDLDDNVMWCLEERVCEIFEWQDGQFSFVDGPPVPNLQVLEIVEAGDAKLPTTHVVMEATRRKDEWERIRQVITNPNELYIVDNEGRANLRNVEASDDPEMVKVLRYLDGKHTIQQISDMVSVPKFDAFAIVAQLVMGGVARPRAPPETVADALRLRSDGELRQARTLLETAAEQIDMPDVIRPLAEICSELGDTPRAVELFLDLIQREQDDGNFAQALDDIEVVIQINPEDPDLQIDRADILLELDRQEEAAEAFIRAADNYVSTRELKLAVDACHRAKDLAPTMPEPHRLLARCYLLDGQTENAVVEYKSLWHTLLTKQRPRRALEVLTGILDEDCKFPRVKDQVIEHAQGSDAVKTSSAVRLLIYVLILVIVGAAAYVGYDLWQNRIKKDQIRAQLADIETELKTQDTADYQDLVERLKNVDATADDDLNMRRNTLIDQVKSSMNQEAEQLLTLINDHIASDELDQAADKLHHLDPDEGRLGASVVATEHHTRLMRLLKERRSDQTAKEHLAKIEQLWELGDFDGAIAALEDVSSDASLESGVRDVLKNKLKELTDLRKSSEWLFRQGERLELEGKRDRFRDEARKRLIALERQRAEDKLASIGKAIQQRDTHQIFKLIDELRELTNEARSEEVRQALSRVELPYTLTIDHHQVAVEVQEGDADTTTYTAPAGTNGAWQLELSYPATATVNVIGKRRGFSDEPKRIAANDRSISGELTLKRGPLWQKDLGSEPVADAVAFGNQILICTKKNTVELLDATTGVNRSIRLPNQVANITRPPFIDRGVAYVSLGGSVHAIDPVARIIKWSWPPGGGNNANLGRSGIWVQRHVIKPGETELFTSYFDQARQQGHVVIVSVDPVTGEFVRYPDAQVGEDISGPPLVHFDTLYVPLSTGVAVYDAASASIRSAPTQLFTVQMRGEVRVRPVPAKIGDRDAVLTVDAYGGVLALNADPFAAERDRNLRNWNTQGAPAAAPVVDLDSEVAYMAYAEAGGVVALDLSKEAQAPVRWRFPANGKIGKIHGRPALGKLGLYIADADGRLYCIDRETGKLRWKSDIGTKITIGVLAHEGRIYVGTEKGQLICFEEGDD